MTIYNLTVLASPTMNGRSTPNSSISTNIIFPNGFKYNDVVKANQTSIVNGVTWYGIYECIRYGSTVVLPAPIVWGAATTSTGTLLRLDSTATDPIPPVEPPTSIYPKEIWLSMTENGERRKYVLV